MKKSLHDAILLAPGGGPTLTFMGAMIAYKITSAETNGVWALLEFTLPPQFEAATLHGHRITQAGFYVLDGTVTFRIGTQASAARAGAFISIPPDTLHSFCNEQDHPARMLEIILPGGFENYYKELVALAKNGQTVLEENPQTLRDLRERYDMFMPDEK